MKCSTGFSGRRDQPFQRETGICCFFIGKDGFFNMKGKYGDCLSAMILVSMFSPDAARAPERQPCQGNCDPCGGPSLQHANQSRDLNDQAAEIEHHV